MRPGFPTRLIAVPAALAALSLAACGGPAPSEERGAPPAAVTASPLASATPVASPTTAAAIPDRFRGVWDVAGGSCNPASDLRLEIGAVSVEFYESLGTVTGVTVQSPDSIVVDLAMEGEGQRWERTTRYVLSDEGATLTPTEIGGPSAPAIPRTRCAE